MSRDDSVRPNERRLRSAHRGKRRNVEFSCEFVEGTAKQFYGTGRRRESVARVYIKQGPAQFTVNGRPVDEYFRNVAWNTAAVEPLKFTQMLDQVEVKCR